MADELEFAEREHDDGRGIREWVLRGPAGAVNFLLSVHPPVGLVIGWHGTPGPDDEGLGECELLPSGTCVPGVAYRAGAELGDRYGRRQDESVIRAELATWYEDRLS